VNCFGIEWFIASQQAWTWTWTNARGFVYDYDY